MNIEEIATKLDELVKLGREEGTDETMVARLAELVDLIRPTEVTFRELACMNIDSHHQHVWVPAHSERTYYCPGIE